MRARKLLPDRVPGFAGDTPRAGEEKRAAQAGFPNAGPHLHRKLW